MKESFQNFLEHKCASIPKIGVLVLFDDELQYPEKSWRLNVTREATEEDLEENHIFENVGDLVWSTSINITHCPFCGEGLYSTSNTTLLSDHKYVHHDHSNWNIQVK